MLMDLSQLRFVANLDLKLFATLLLPALLVMMVGCGGAGTSLARPAVPPTPVGAPQGTLTVSPNVLSFGNVVVGKIGTLKLTLTDSGNTAVAISRMQVSGSGFASAPGNPALPVSIAPGSGMQFALQFAPPAAGAATGSVTFASNAAGAPLTSSLTGTGVAAQSHAVTLRWIASASAVAGYNVYRGTASSGPFARLTPAPTTATQFSDANVQAGQTYYYTVTSVDASGVESAYSNVVAVAIPVP